MIDFCVFYFSYLLSLVAFCFSLSLTAFYKLFKIELPVLNAKPDSHSVWLSCTHRRMGGREQRESNSTDPLVGQNVPAVLLAADV